MFDVHEFQVLHDAGSNDLSSDVSDFIFLHVQVLQVGEEIRIGEREHAFSCYVIVSYQEFEKVVEIVANQKIVEALVAESVVLQAQESQLVDVFAQGKILSSLRTDVVVIEVELAEVRHVACFCKMLQAGVSDLVSAQI